MNNWQAKKIGDIADVYDGTHQTPDYTSEGVPFFSVEHVTSNDFSNTKFISRDVYNKEIKRVRIDFGDILMTRIGDVGTAKYIDWDKDASFYVSLALIKCRQDVNSKFLSQLINSDIFHREIWGKTIHVAFPNKINLGDISKCRLKLPDLPEQERIVSVLEVWDEYLEKLDRKIALKEELKKGLMQQLLTGKKRLPGFSGKWRKVKLSDISEIKTGGKNNQDKNVNGRYPFFVRSPFIERIDSYSFDGEAILVPGEGNIGKIFHYINGKFDYHQRVYGISHFNNDVSGKYVYYNLTKNFAKQAMRDSAKAAVDSLRLPTFTNFIIQLPCCDEQNQIVNLIDCAYNEIDTLKNMRSSLRLQKKYLLKNLITGKIRTPENLTLKRSL